MTRLLKQLLIMITLGCASSCDVDTKRIEEELKRDASRHGYVGVMRALEVTDRAIDVAETARCPDPLAPPFRGTFRSSITVSLSRHGRAIRTYTSHRQFISRDGLFVVSTDETTRDEHQLDHTRSKRWFFDGDRAVIEETVGTGTIVGSREPSADERARMRDAALSPVRFATAFLEPDKTPCGSIADWMPVVSQVTNVEIKKQGEGARTKQLNLRISLGATAALQVDYEHTLDDDAEPIDIPVVPKTATLREPHDERQLVETLRTEGWFKTDE